MRVVLMLWLLGVGLFKKKYNTKAVLSTKHFKLNQLCIHSGGAILTTICKLLVCLIIIHQSLNHG